MDGERWATDDELRAARGRFAAKIPGYVQPVAYGLARLDDAALTFGHVNDVGGTHLLPAVVLASVCGYVATTTTFDLTAQQVAEAVSRLAPAEAATHWQHPNLWSWRELLDGADSGSSFVAFFVRDVDDEPVNGHDVAFRAQLNGEA